MGKKTDYSIKEFEVDVKRKLGFRLDYSLNLLQTMEPTQVAFLAYDLVDAGGKPFSRSNQKIKHPKLDFDSAVMLDLDYLLKFLTLARKYSRHAYFFTKTDKPAMVVVETHDGGVRPYLEDSSGVTDGYLNRLYYCLAPRVAHDEGDSFDADLHYSKFLLDGQTIHKKDNGKIKEEEAAKEKKRLEAKRLREQADAIEKSI